ncbi:outer membrane protein [Bartonella bacilliformis]|uniref:Outer membrane protein beta-barrel domain-containing protein n=1 Tax=Bartonella bacilliformis Ver097 TaxID=1293911 RepID=A0A072R5T8_BARBA|nr:outer membrane protein [Bartonella bacilliformis]KEG21115.1 hypothetical protein H710_00062 [Bartonella bacilliformis Ver097]
MNKKNILLSLCVVALSLPSLVQAADTVIMSKAQTAQKAISIVDHSDLSWGGLYFGVQVGGISGNLSYHKAASGEDKDSSEKLPKLSGFIGGLYLGSNVELGGGFVVGVDTDMVWSHQKYKQLSDPIRVDDEVLKLHQALMSYYGHNFNSLKIGDKIAYNVTHKANWTGATRIRLAFSSDRMMPYIAGGVSYTQLQITPWFEVTPTKGEVSSIDFMNDKKTMVGYTLGAGFEFLMTDDVILRTEYRYSDFGKKNFLKDTSKISYKTSDLRIGVAYKF